MASVRPVVVPFPPISPASVYGSFWGREEASKIPPLVGWAAPMNRVAVSSSLLQ